MKIHVLQRDDNNYKVHTRWFKHHEIEQNAKECPFGAFLNSSSLLENIDDYVSDNNVDYHSLNEELDEEALIHNYGQNWVQALCWDNLMSLTFLLHALLIHHLHFQLPDAAKLISEKVFL